MRVFLDANIIAKPVTRTLLMVGGPVSGFEVCWSLFAEEEAARHMRSQALPPDAIRERFGGDLTPRGTHADQFTNTSPKDRQILADAVASHSSHLITEDVDDFSDEDLRSVNLTAVNPDVFLCHLMSEEGYFTVLKLLSHTQHHPPRSPEEIHSALGRQHPLLTSRFSNYFELRPQPPAQRPPRATVRGVNPLEF